MLERILKYWNKPYPSLDNRREVFYIALTFGFFVFLFLFVFSPFEVDKKTQSSFWYLVGFGIITFVVVLTIFFLISLIPNSIIDRKKWQLKHTFIVSLFNLVTISIANYFFMKIAVDTEPAAIWKVLFYTIAVGIFPVSIILVYYERQLSKEDRKTASKAPGLIENRRKLTDGKKDNKGLIDISADVQADSFSVKSDKLLLVKAEGNYSTFFIENDDSYSKKIARVPFKNVENILKKFNDFKKCHRSYIINIEKITGADENARNVILCIDNMQLKIPVSRSKEKAILSAIGSK